MSDQHARDRIISAAGPIFADKGFQSATIRDICDQAGANVAAVNYYFGDKEHLYLETVKAARVSRVEEAPLPDWTASTPTQEKLADFVRTIATRMVGLQEAPWQVRLMMRELLQPTSACKDLIRDYFRPHFELLLGIVDEVLPTDTPKHRREQIAYSIIGQCVFYRLSSSVVRLMVGDEDLGKHYTIEQIADHVARFSTAALGLSQPLSQPSTTNADITPASG